MRRLAEWLTEVSEKIEYSGLGRKEKATLTTLIYVYLKRYPSVGGVRLVIDLLKFYPEKIKPIYAKLGFRGHGYYSLFEKLKPLLMQLPFVDREALAEHGVVNFKRGGGVG